MLTHPAVLECAVVGVPDPYRGETVKLFLALKPGQSLTAEAMTQFLADKLSAHRDAEADRIPRQPAQDRHRQDLQEGPPRRRNSRMKNVFIAGYVRSPFHFAAKGALTRVRPGRHAGGRDPGPAAEDRRAGRGYRGSDRRLRHARGRAGPEHRAADGAAGGAADQRRRDHGQPLLRLVHAGDPHGGGRDPDRRRRGLHLRRHRIHDPRADGRLQPDAQSPARRTISQAYISMGETAENLARKYKIGARAAGEARRRQPCPRRRGARRPASSRTRSCPSPPAISGVEKDGCIRPGTDREDPGRAEARLRRGRHGDRRHLLAADRRRVGDAGRDRGIRQGPWAEAARQAPQHRGRRLRAGDHGHRPGGGDAEGAEARRARRSSDIDIIELNEAFAVQALACMRRSRHRLGQDQYRRRRHRARPSAGRHRRAHHRQGGRAS